jgi:serine/threonine-protein kinase
VANPRIAEALLATLDVETRDTLAEAPRATLRPKPSTDTARRALAVLEQLAGHSPTASLQLRPGDEIGRGGMGVIRAAEQVALGRTVAIKTVRPDHKSPDAALDLLREAWITGSLEHPNIVPVHHLGVDDRGLPLIVLKKIEGVSWADIAGDAEAVQRRFGSRDLLAWNIGILLRVLDAIRFAHSRGILHRDLKPANVMIGDFGEVYLLDWGIAVSLRPDPTGRLPVVGDSRQIVGTPCYMAPEMVEVTMELTERTDVYLAGAVLYELLAGRPPHLAPTAVATMTSIALSQPELPADAPPELAAICRRAMHAEPEQRFASADELRLALQRYLDHRGSELLAVGAQARLRELRAALAADDEDGVHRLFGACKFGFHEALHAWPDNAAARAGLTEATIAVAEFELAHDAPAAAVALLGELDPPPPLLVKARAALASQRQSHDLSVNVAARSALVAAFGGVFTLVPIVMALVPSLSLQDRATFIGGPWLAFSLATPVAVLAYRRFGTTEIDRRLLLAIPFTFLMQAIVGTGLAVAGAPLDKALIIYPALWGTMCGLVALLAEPRIAPAALGYIVAFLVSATFPSYRLWAISAANAVLSLNALMWYRGKCRLASELERRC